MKKAIVFVLRLYCGRLPRHFKNRRQKHDVTGIRILIAEENIPNLGMVQMQDQETGELLLVNTGPNCAQPILQLPSRKGGLFQ